MKTIKDAVEYYKGIYPATDRDVRDCIAYTEVYGWTACYRDSSYLVCTKQQFEDQVKEQKMKEQKYKYVNANIKTVGELIQILLLGEIQVFHEESQLTINGYVDVYCKCFGSDRLNINRINAILPSLTTHQPVPWYEQEGVFPCLVMCDSIPFLVTELRGEHLIIGRDYGVILATEAEPLTPSEAAKYGVEL